MKLALIQSIAQLEAKARKDSRYHAPAVSAAQKLGMEGDTWTDALDFLKWHGDEDEAVDEVNFFLAGE